MRTSDIFGFLIGREESIRRVAASRWAWLVGLILVFTAGIAREYDQTYIPYFGIRFLFPIITSFIAAAIIYGGLFGFILPKPAKPSNAAVSERKGGFICFLGLFWMTAPLAWIYAFPVEHLFDSYTAAQINIGLLTFVATARVLVLCRALSVLCEVPFFRVLTSVLLVSGAIVFFGSIAVSIVTFHTLIQTMGGLRNSPEESLLSEAAGTAFLGSLATGFVCGILHLIRNKNEPPRKELPSNSLNEKPLLFPCIAVAVWIAVTIPQQIKLERNHRAMKLLNNHKYKEMLAFLSSHSQDDFNKVTRLPPDPYEYWGLKDLPDVIRALDGNTAPWVREMYCGHLKIALQHFGMRDREAISLCVRDVLQLPGGKEWVLANRVVIEEHFNRVSIDNSYFGVSELIDKLRGLGLKIEKQERKN